MAMRSDLAVSVLTTVLAPIKWAGAYAGWSRARAETRTGSARARENCCISILR